jgi:hypothetical protein
MNRGVYVNNSEMIGNVSERSLAKVLIDFMNLQTPEVQDALADVLCDKGDRFICGWNSGKRYYRITQGIFDGNLSFNDFLKAIQITAMEMRKNKKNISYVGFPGVIENYKSLPENSDERKLNKYKGMINCCIKNGDCLDQRGVRNTFLGIPIGRQRSVSICTMGGRRRTRYKRKTRRMRRTRR